MSVPAGQHVMAMKYAHTGQTADSNGPSVVSFTLTTNDITGVSQNNPAAANTQYDIALCACVIGTDCPTTLPPAPPGVMGPWYLLNTGGTASGVGTVLRARIIPVYTTTPQPYTYTSYRAFCNSKSLRVWFDATSGGGSSSQVIYDVSTNINAGGHDIINNLLAGMQYGAESGHGGFPIAWQRDMLWQLQAAGVPVGQHKAAMKYHHAAQTDNSSPASMVTFTIDAGYAGMSSMSASNPGAGTTYDIALCACNMGEDCP